MATASLRRPLPRIAGVLAGLALLAALALGSILIGSRSLTVPVVLEALGGSGTYDDLYIVWRLRLPRIVLAIAVGAALAVAGALMQALTRNPLADPGVLGTNAGAAFLVALGIGLFGVSGIAGYMWFSMLGAFGATVLVYVIGSIGRGPASPLRLTLAGVALAAVLGGVTTGMTLRDPDTFSQLQQWRAGSVAGRDLALLWPVLPLLLLGLLCAALAARPLNAMALGEDLARTVGAGVARTRFLVVIAVTLLCGGATAIAGPIGFVGLMVPHVARWIIGPDQRWILAYSLVLGPILVLAADVLGRLITPSELPVGIVTAFVGAPVLILLARRKGASGL